MNKDLELWDAAAEGWDSKIAQSGTYRSMLIENALNKLVNDCSGKIILDAGCGNGYFANWLKNKGAEVTGIDGAAKMIELAKSKYSNIEFLVHDLTQQIPFADSKFDMVISNMLLMHMENISIFLKEAKRLIKPGGSLIFSVLHPAFNYPVARLYKTIFKKITLSHPSLILDDYYSKESGRFESHLGQKLTHYHRTLEEYTQELKSAGWAITEIIEPHELPKDFLNEHPKFAYATKFPRFIFFNCKAL